MIRYTNHRNTAPNHPLKYTFQSPWRAALTLLHTDLLYGGAVSLIRDVDGTLTRIECDTNTPFVRDTSIYEGPPVEMDKMHSVVTAFQTLTGKESILTSGDAQGRLLGVAITLAVMAHALKLPINTFDSVRKDLETSEGYMNLDDVGALIDLIDEGNSIMCVLEAVKRPNPSPHVVYVSKPRVAA